MIVIFVMVVVVLFIEGNLSSGECENCDNCWVFVVFVVSGFLFVYLLVLIDCFDIWIFGGDMGCWIGVGLYFVGGVLCIWFVFVFGKCFSGFVVI